MSISFSVLVLQPLFPHFLWSRPIFVSPSLLYDSLFSNPVIQRHSRLRLAWNAAPKKAPLTYPYSIVPPKLETACPPVRTWPLRLSLPRLLRPRLPSRLGHVDTHRLRQHHLDTSSPLLRPAPPVSSNHPTLACSLSCTQPDYPACSSASNGPVLRRLLSDSATRPILWPEPSRHLLC